MICNRFFVIIIQELFSKVIVIDPKVIYYFSITYIAANLQNIRFVCLLFQLLVHVIVNNVQTMAERLFKQHEKTSRLIILWFQKYLLNETMQD